MSAMVQVGKIALAAMVLVETIVFLVLVEEGLAVPTVPVMVEKDARRVMDLVGIHGMTQVVHVAMGEDIEIVMTATEGDIRNVACVGDEVIMIVFHVMVVDMMNVMNVMDTGNCVLNVTDVMAMEN
jgi:hypothetical protein